MKVAIRPIVQQDIHAVAVVLDAACRAAFRPFVPAHILDEESVETRERQILRCHQERADETVVIEWDGQIVGFATFGRSRDTDADGTTGELWRLYVSPDWWRKGIGRQAVCWVLDVLADRGYKTVTLWVLEKNEPARRFYEALGFRFDGTSKPIPIGVPLTEVRYKKPTPNAGISH